METVLWLIPPAVSIGFGAYVVPHPASAGNIAACFAATLIAWSVMGAARWLAIKK